MGGNYAVSQRGSEIHPWVNAVAGFCLLKDASGSSTLTPDIGVLPAGSLASLGRAVSCRQKPRGTPRPRPSPGLGEQSVGGQLEGPHPSYCQ